MGEGAETPRELPSFDLLSGYEATVDNSTTVVGLQRCAATTEGLRQVAISSEDGAPLFIVGQARPNRQGGLTGTAGTGAPSTLDRVELYFWQPKGVPDSQRVTSERGSDPSEGPSGSATPPAPGSGRSSGEDGVAKPDPTAATSTPAPTPQNTPVNRR